MPKEETKFIGTPSNWFANKTTNGIKTIENSKEKVSLSMPSICVLDGKNASVKKYPGTIKAIISAKMLGKNSMKAILKTIQCWALKPFPVLLIS